MNNEDEIITAIACVVFAIIIALVTLGFYTYECSTKANIQELEWSYGPIQGCMVRERNGKWIDYARLRYME
jgi:hypothetical protein